MKKIISLITKEYILFWNDKVAVSLTFLVPIFLIFIFGSIFGGGTSSPTGIRLALVNESDAYIAHKLEKTLDTMSVFRIIKTFTDEEGKQIEFDSTSVKDFVRKGSASSALVIPEDAYSDTSTGLKLKFYYDPRNDIEMQLVQGILQKTIMEQLPQMFSKNMLRQTEKFLGPDSGRFFNSEMALVISKYFDVDTSEILNPDLNEEETNADEDTAGGSVDFFNNILQLEKQQLVGQDIKSPMATRNVGGWAMMFLLFTLTASSASLFDDKKNGVVLRILSGPISKADILWSKYIFCISLGVLQIFVLFLAGKFLYQVDIFSNIFNLFLMILAGATVCASFGMLLAAVSKTAAQANGWGTFLILAMSAIGGAWFPTFLMPSYVQFFSKLTFVYWTVEGFIEVLWRGVGLIDILPHLGILTGMAIIIISITLWQFKKGHVL